MKWGLWYKSYLQFGLFPSTFRFCLSSCQRQFETIPKQNRISPLLHHSFPSAAGHNCAQIYCSRCRQKIKNLSVFCSFLLIVGGRWIWREKMRWYDWENFMKTKAGTPSRISAAGNWNATARINRRARQMTSALSIVGRVSVQISWFKTPKYP